jgi:L-alanine-DL-glutamate epimerase-like enolase superfamily enzyme
MGLVHPKADASSALHLYTDGYRDTLDAIDARGHVPIPQKPGLGAEINWDWVNRNLIGTAVYSL